MPAHSGRWRRLHAPIPIHELDEFERLQLEQRTDWRGLQRPDE
jgi:hypothetical protein